jgi:hypothetical protein
MLCYANAYVDHTIKNSYIILIETGSIVVRHDCYFRHFTPFSSLLDAVENRHPSTFDGEIPVNYDDMFIDLRTDNDATNGNPFPSLLDAVENRHPSTFVREIPVNYDDMFIDIRTNNATNGNPLQSTSSGADYDQLLGQAEHGSIPLQSSILRNPWFLK